MSLVVVMHFGAGNPLHGIEISMFWFYLNVILYTYPKMCAAAGTKSCKTNANDIFSENCYVKDYENAKLVNLPSC